MKQAMRNAISNRALRPMLNELCHTKGCCCKEVKIIRGKGMIPLKKNNFDGSRILLALCIYELCY